MKIRLLYDLPVCASHGAKAGRVFTVKKEDIVQKPYGFIVISDKGVELKVLPNECEVVE